LQRPDSTVVWSACNSNETHRFYYTPHTVAGCLLHHPMLTQNFVHLFRGHRLDPFFRL
jgi:hypothetical protein